jgi:DNA (cytosine-5)-methyltransferase 1
MGYHRAGFDVVGVDVSPQPRYPFEFRQADALEFVAEHGCEFDAIHASPPCQAHTTMSNRWRGAGGKADGWVNLIGPTRDRLTASGKPWVLENVPGARKHMTAPTTLHGGMFGVGVDRPRLFDTSFLLLIPQAPRTVNPLGVYGKAHDGRRLFTRADGSEQRAPKTLAEAQEAMGMPWADWDGCREAIPPAYTQWIGSQLLDHLAERVA